MQAKTPEGKARQVQAMVEGRRHWVERMKAEGRKFLGGRKSGPDWMTPKMRERAAEEIAYVRVLMDDLQLPQYDDQ